MRNILIYSIFMCFLGVKAQNKPILSILSPKLTAEELWITGKKSLSIEGRIINYTGIEELSITVKNAYNVPVEIDSLGSFRQEIFLHSEVDTIIFLVHHSEKYDDFEMKFAISYKARYNTDSDTKFSQFLEVAQHLVDDSVNWVSDNVFYTDISDYVNLKLISQNPKKHDNYYSLFHSSTDTNWFKIAYYDANETFTNYEIEARKIDNFIVYLFEEYEDITHKEKTYTFRRFLFNDLLHSNRFLVCFAEDKRVNKHFDLLNIICITQLKNHFYPKKKLILNRGTLDFLTVYNCNFDVYYTFNKNKLYSERVYMPYPKYDSKTSCPFYVNMLGFSLLLEEQTLWDDIRILFDDMMSTKELGTFFPKEDYEANTLLNIKDKKNKTLLPIWIKEKDKFIFYYQRPVGIYD